MEQDVPIQPGNLMATILGSRAWDHIRSMPPLTDPDERAQLKDFNPYQWLKGAAINWFMSVIEAKFPETVICVDSYFCVKMLEIGMTYDRLERQAFMKRNLVFSCRRFMFFPFNETVVNVDKGQLEGVHWTIVIADIQERVLVFHDPMGAKQVDGALKVTTISRFLRQRGKKDPRDKSLDKYWRYQYGGPDIPRQTDGSSCGKFILAYAGLTAAGQPLNSFGQEHMGRFGKDMARQLALVLG
jgi:Ulp1 family protease